MENYKKQANYFENYNPKEIYKPTSFWQNLIKKNFSLIKKGKLTKFRKTSVGFVGFTPYHSEITRYKIKKANILNIKKVINSTIIIQKGKRKIISLIDSVLSGKTRATEQYKILLTDNIKPFFYNFNESLTGKPSEYYVFNNNRYSASSLNYLTGLLYLKKHIKGFDNKTFLEIGGGFGTVGEILYKMKTKNFKYINLDLPPLNIISDYYLRKSCYQKIGNHFKFKKKKKNFN